MPNLYQKKVMFKAHKRIEKKRKAVERASVKDKLAEKKEAASLNETRKGIMANKIDAVI